MPNTNVIRSLVLTAILSASLGGCFHVPNTATSESPTAPIATVPISDSTPLTTLIKQQSIASLDPNLKMPLLEQAMIELGKSDPAGHYRGITYDLTHGNDLDRDWLIQTPDIWNQPGTHLSAFPVECKTCDADFHLPSCRSNADCAAEGGRCGTLESFEGRPKTKHIKMCLGQSDRVIDRWYSMVVHAREAVDITLLQPSPDTRFMAALRNAITMLARKRRAITVRVLVGQYPPDNYDANAMLEQLVRDARAIPGSRLTLYAAAMRSCSASPGCSSFSWNHSKIVAVDGHRALLGGHNLYSQDYLDSDPIHDISMEVEGPAAVDAHHFADRLWSFVCANSGTDSVVTSFEYQADTGKIGAGCLSAMHLSDPDTGRLFGGTPILAIGRLGSGITADFANQSELARDMLLGSARRTIRIAQQDIAFSRPGVPGFSYPAGVTYPESTLERIADFLLSGGDAYIVLSNLGAVGESKMSYSNGVPIADLARKIQGVAHGRTHMSDSDLVTLLCQRLHLAPFRFGPDSTWPNGRAIGNHGKFWMVDDHVFYIGSDNMYPADLQEFGYITDDRRAAATLRRSYWGPLWQWSSRAAISGSETSTCVFRS